MKRMEITSTDKHKTISHYVNQFGDQLYDWAFYKTSDEATAKDLVQDTFVSAFLHYDNFNKNSSAKTWLFIILKNKIIDFYRKKASLNDTGFQTSEDEISPWFDPDDRWKKEFWPSSWGASDESLLDDPEFEAILNKCITKLPVAWSSCIQLKYLSEKETPVICQELNITASNLWQILHRAKLQLRNCLEKNWFTI